MHLFISVYIYICRYVCGCLDCLDFSWQQPSKQGASNKQSSQHANGHPSVVRRPALEVACTHARMHTRMHARMHTSTEGTHNRQICACVYQYI